MNLRLILSLIVLVAFSSCNRLLVTESTRRVITDSQAFLKFQIVGSDKDPSKSINKAESIIQKLKKGLKGTIDKENIKVMRPQIEMQSSNEGKITFYDTIIQVELSTNKNIGQVIKIADKFGTLIDVTYRVSQDQREQVKSELVSQAISKAKQKAERYAEAIGVQLDDIQLIQVDDNVESSNDHSEIRVDVSVIYNLFNPEDEISQQQEIGSDDFKLEDIKDIAFNQEDETRFQEEDIKVQEIIEEEKQQKVQQNISRNNEKTKKKKAQKDKQL